MTYELTNASDLAAVRAALKVAPTLPARPLASALGDSITADAIAGSSIFTSWGMLAWARRFLKGRIDLPAERIYAVAGATVADVVNNQLASAVADVSDTVFIQIGTNSLGSVTNAALTTGATGIQTIYDTLIAAGKFVIATPIRCHDDGVFALSGAILQQMTYVNRWINRYAETHRGIMVLDVNPAYIDFATGYARAAFLRDGLHDSVASAMAGGKFISDALSPLLAPTDARFMHVGDTYDATNNPTGSLISNSIMAGTGGSTINGATGVVASGFRGFLSTGGATTLTAAYSKGTDATYSTLPVQIITLGGTGDGTSALIDQELAISGLLSVGDVIFAECEVELTITSGNIDACALSLICESSGFASLAAAWDGFPGSTGNMAPGTYSFSLKTGNVTVPANTVYFDPTLTIRTVSGSINAVAKVKRFAVRKVI